MKIRPQILVAMLVIGTLGALVIVLVPEHVDKIITGAITALGMLGMKLLEGE